MGFRIGRRFVPTSTITRRMDRQDLRRQREARAKAGSFPVQFLRPEIMPWASVEIVHVDDTVTVLTPARTETFDQADARIQREMRAEAVEETPTAPLDGQERLKRIAHVVLEPAPVSQVEQTIEDAERARFHTFITDPATGPLLDAMLADNDATDAAILADRENEAHWQSERDGDACSSACGFCGRCS